MFQAIRALTVIKILKTSKKFLQNESFNSFSLKCFDLSCTPTIDTIIYIAKHHHSSSSEIFSKENDQLSLRFIEIMRFHKLLQIKIEIRSYEA